jgi:hypothetical protein
MCDLLFFARYTTLSWLARSRYNTFKWSDLFQCDRTIKVQPGVLLNRIYPIELETKHPQRGHTAAHGQDRIYVWAYVCHGPETAKS